MRNYMRDKILEGCDEYDAEIEDLNNKLQAAWQEIEQLKQEVAELSQQED